MERDPRGFRASDLETVAQAANRAGVSVSYMHRLLRQGKLDFCKVGQLTMVLKHHTDALSKDREAWYEANRQGA